MRSLRSQIHGVGGGGPGAGGGAGELVFSGEEFQFGKMRKF